MQSASQSKGKEVLLFYLSKLILSKRILLVKNWGDLEWVLCEKAKKQAEGFMVNYRICRRNV